MTAADFKAIRQAAGLSQVALATLLRIENKRSIQRWEAGDIAVSGPASIIMELLAKCQLPARYLTR